MSSRRNSELQSEWKREGYELRVEKTKRREARCQECEEIIRCIAVVLRKYGIAFQQESARLLLVMTLCRPRIEFFKMKCGFTQNAGESKAARTDMRLESLEDGLLSTGRWSELVLREFPSNK